MPDPVPIIDSLGHIATRQQLIAHGCSGYDLTRAVRLGRIRRVRQARYATPSAPWAAIEATRVGGLLAGPSAASSYGLWSGFDARLHISVGANSSRLRTNVAPSFRPPSLTPDISSRPVVVHWLEGGAVPEQGPECWRVSLADCLRQVVAWCDRETAVACLDTALSVYRIPRPELLGLFDGASPLARRTALRCRSGSESGLESLVRQRLGQHGFPVRQQVEFAGVGRVDMALLGTRILIELDGREHHAGAFERDRWRDAELASRGYTVLRLSYERVTRDWSWCLRVISQAAATRR